MLHAGLDLSRKRLDFCLLDESGERIEVGATPPDADGLRSLARRLARHDQPVRAAIESMNGARFVHDQLELAGWQVEIADALKVKGLAPLACKTDRIDAWVLAELCASRFGAGDLAARPVGRGPSGSAPVSGFISSATAAVSSSVSTRLCSRTASPAPSPTCSVSPAARCSSGWRCPSRGRDPRRQPALDRRARPADHDLRTRAAPAGRRPPLRAAADDRTRDRLGARLHDRGRDRRHRPLPVATTARRLHRPLPARLPIRQLRPPRPARQERPPLPALGADRSDRPRLQPPAYRDRYQRTKTRLGKQRGAKVAQVDLARRLAEAIWHMLTRDQPFAPAGATDPLAA